MLIEVGWKKGITLGQSAVSDESSVRSQSDKPMHQGDKVHRTCEATTLCDKSEQEQLGMSSSGSTRPSSRPRDGYIREQRQDAVLDVPGAH